MIKNIKKIIAEALILTMVIPNIAANAFVNSELDSSISNIEEAAINNNVNKENSELETEEKKVEEESSEEVKEENSQSDEEIIQELEVVEENNSIVNSIYEKKYISQAINYSTDMYSDHEHKDEDCEYEKEEFLLKTQGLENYTLLQTKTEDAYEVALAYGDGTYRFVGSTNSYDDAMEMIQYIPAEMSDEQGIPVILNEDGKVTYATKYIVKFLKNVNGIPHLKHNDECYEKDKDGNFVLDKNGNRVVRETHPLEITNIYTNSKLNSAYTYVNQGYIDDVPAIESYSTAAKVMVNGYIGWINNKYKEIYKDANGVEKVYNWSDYVIVPTNQVSNPSYYIAQGGILYHYISLDLQSAANSTGTKIPIGVAPSYLSEGVRYLSYDGNYFYNGSNIEVALNRIIDNLNAGNREHAVNANNPYYPYYQYLPFRSKTVYTADDLDNYINANTNANSKLRGLGQTLKESEKLYGVNALLTLGVAINESARGMSAISQSKNNLFGMEAFDSDTGQAIIFNTPGESVLHFTKEYISKGYCDQEDWRYFGGFLGNKNLGANVKYASDPFWGEKASRYAFEIDYYLSGSNVSSLIDTNLYQVAIYNLAKEVKNSSGEGLYTVDKIGSTFILYNKEVVNINGTNYYEIYPERTNPLMQWNEKQKKYVPTEFHGNYDWSSKGYISTGGITLINNKKELKPTVQVLGGATRFETAVELSKSKFNTADTVVLINKTAIFDGISATPLATAAKAPILYTEKKYLHEATKNEIIRLNPKKVIIVGGSGIVTDDVINELKSMGVAQVDRLGGAYRYDTALEVAKYIDTNYYDVSEVFVVNGAADADAMSIGAVGGKNNMPILLTQTNSIPANTFNWLRDEELSNAYVIGGTGIVTDNVLNTLNTITKNDIRGNRVGGQNRQDTNALIINRFFGDELNVVYAARSHILFDALAVGPIAAMDKAPVVLIPVDINQSQRNALTGKVAKKIIQAGLDFPQQGINTLREILKAYDL